MTVYDAETRSLLQNGQPKPSISTYDQPDVNPTARSTSPSARKRQRARRRTGSKTVPGKGWFTYVRLYGPLEPFFEQTWKPDDIVKV